MSKIRLLTNVSGSEIVLADMNGLAIPAGDTVNGLVFSESILMGSSDVLHALLNGTLSLNDGSASYTGMEAVDVLKGLTTQYTKDGKQIFTASDRPKDHYRHFTGRGDDVALGKIGQGERIHLIAEPGQTATLDVKFVDDVYIRDGKIRYLNAGFDSHLNIDVVCPPGVPFPAPNGNGTLDRVGGQFVPNANGTGTYMTAPVEVVLFRFLNEFHLVGSEEIDEIDSPEPFMLYAPYFLKVSIGADPEITGPLKAAITIGMYRKKTV